MSHKQTEKFCKLDSASKMMLKQAMTEFGLSARAHDEMCKVGRTIADLAGEETKARGLMGADCIISGISPAIAQTLILQEN
jgi:magnesium chelatase family protein